MRVIAAILAATLAGCAGNSAPQRWGRADGQPAQFGDEQRFWADKAECDYDVEKARASVPIQPYYAQPGLSPYAAGVNAMSHATAVANSMPGPRLFAACMNARGWRQHS